MDIMSALKKVTTEIRDWTDNNKVSKVSGKGLSTNDYTSADKTKVQNMPNDLVILDNKLYLAQDGMPLDDSAVTLPTGGGGGGGTSASITLTNLGESNFTIAVGGIANLNFKYYSSETSETATAYVYVNDILKKTYSVNPGENTLDIGGLLAEGINSIKLTVLDIYSNSKSLQFSVNVVSLRITSTFDDSIIYDGDINIRYIPYGAISKDVHLSIDGHDTVIAVTSETNKQQSYIIDGSSLTHGSHDLVLYLSAEVNGVQITSNKLYYSIIKTESGVTTPIISSVCTIESITQGEQVQVTYVVYDPVSLNTDVSLIVYQNNEVYSNITRTVDATKQMWITSDLPVGSVTLTLKYGTIERSHNITVVENNINVSIKTTDLEFELKAAGRSNEDIDRDIWENNGITTTFERVNYQLTGWIPDENGDTALRLSGGAKATINFMPFKSDSRSTGRTLEFEYAIRDVNNRNAIAVSCFNSNIGFQIKADTAIMRSEQTIVSCNYTDEEKIHVAFVIEPRTEYRLMSVYLNGVLSGVKQYPENDNFQQGSDPVNIEIGSPYCSIDVYAIRSYNTALTADEIKGNYIAGITDISKQLSIYEDNNIYDIYGNLSFDKLKDKIPVLVITGNSLPTYKGDKKKVSISFTHPEKPSLNYEDTATIDIQGTSSQFYIRKNWKIKMSNYHMIDTDKIETKVICTKADYAESTGSHNTAGANYVHTLYGDSKVLPQISDERVRTTIYGYPIAIFYKTDTAATPEFMGKYNYNYDKGSEEAFGFTISYPDAFSVEFCNNTSDACLFHGEIPEDFSDDFEFRYPDGYEDISDFKVMHDWVVSTYQDNATNQQLSETYIGSDGTSYDTDTAEYRLAKFKKEFTEYFDMDFALVYYVYGLMGMYVDSFAKNLFLTTFDRKHWYCYWYDLDTSFGINNEGVLAFSPYLEDIDTQDGALIFNGQSSTLWTNFRQAFTDEIQATYKEWRSAGLLTYDQIIEYFITNQVNRWSMSIYNEDSDYKYISMLRSDNDASNLYQVRGTGSEHLRYFIKNRLMYLDSKWYAGDYPDDIVSLRIYTPSGDLTVTPSANITITPYSNIYAGVRYKANGTLQQQRAEANVPVTFVAPNETFNDTETAIYGASEISSLGDLSPLYCGTINLSKATKLVEAIVGNGTLGYSNGNLKEFVVGTNYLLKKIDVQNCPNLINPLALSNCPNIEEIYATGSGITGLELPSSGYLKKVYLPGTLTNLTVTNQQYIEEFSLEGYDNLTTLRIEKATNIPVEDIMLNAPNLNRIRLLDISWEAESEEALASTITKFKSCLGLDANGNNIDKAVVTGYVKVPSISDELYNDIYENFPNLVVDDGSGKPYIINFLDRSGNSLFVTRLAEGEDAFDPIETGDIEKPADIVTEDARYIFTGWSTMPTNVSSHYRITPVYKTQYAVKYYNDTTLLYTEYIDQGSAAPDPVLTGTITTPTKDGTDDLHYTFSGWDNLPTNIQKTMNVYAQFTNVYPVRYYSDDSSTLHYTQWVIEGQDAFDPVASGDVAAPTKESTVDDMFYGFSAWDNIPTNVSAITSVHAVYDIYWAVRFYNDTIEVDMQKVKEGASAVNPITRENNPIEIPTKESTAQYDFTFSKWDSDYTNITAATKVYAVYSSTIRVYTVSFYNMENLLYTVENIQYGSSATYSGDIPTKLGVDDPENYDFVGWNPNPEYITGETKCYALFRYKGYLQDDWDTIAENVANGTAVDLYPIGARKEFIITLLDGNEYTVDVEIIAHNHDNLADDSGKATLTFFCKSLPGFYRRMDDANTDGWAASEMREFINGELLDALPEKLRTVIKPVYKISDGGANNKSLVTTTDSCWLASYNEVGLVDGTNNLTGQGEIYSQTFTYGSGENTSRVRYLPDGYTPGGWWLRTSRYGSLNESPLFYRIINKGGAYGDVVTNLFYVAFGFCI